MAASRRSKFVLRAGKTIGIVSASALVALAGGCKHHRSAMRPVYAAPAPVVVEPDPCPPGSPCAPAFGDDVVSPPAPSLLPPTDFSVVPPRGSSVVPQTEEEPRLEPSTVPPEAAPSDSNDGPSLEAPRSSSRPARRSGPPVRNATLRTRLSKYVNDPNDLFQPPKADRPWRYVVLHHSAHAEGSYAEIDREHRAKIGSAGCGYHFVIGNGTGSPDGQIEVAQRWADQRGGAHCRDAKSPAVNDYGIGICLVGDLNSAEPTPRQVESARLLVAYLQERYRIPANAVDTHNHLAGGPTVCPGKHFPSGDILSKGSVAARW